MIKKITYQLFSRGVAITPLVAFRIVFGALVLFSTLRFLWNGWVNQLYIQPKFFFTYYGFDWVKPLPGVWMYLPFMLMIIGAIGIILGCFYRIAAILYFVSFTYVELLDKSNYLNHYYFVSIIAFLLIWMPAHADFSIDAKRKPFIRRTEIPSWSINLLKIQLGIVYCYAGMAKLNADWLLEAQPLRLWLQAFRDTPIVGNLLASTWVAFAFSWFGCFYDLTIPFFLSIKKTRNIAYFFVVVFHVLTWILFPIGVFPWVMICATLIFFPAWVHEKWLRPLKQLFRWNFQPKTSSMLVRKSSLFLVYSFVGIQLLIPFRYLLYDGNLFWNEEGFRFSWRVMLMEKKAYATFYIVDPKTNGSIEINNYDYLTPGQIDQMSRQPDMILQYAHFLGTKFQDTLLNYNKVQLHLQQPKVCAEVYATLNGRPNQLMVDKQTDLMKQSYNLGHRQWILPLIEN